MTPPLPIRNAFGQPIRPPSAAQKRRAAAWAPFAPKQQQQPKETRR